MRGSNSVYFPRQHPKLGGNWLALLYIAPVKAERRTRDTADAPTTQPQLLGHLVPSARQQTRVVHDQLHLESFIDGLYTCVNSLSAITSEMTPAVLRPKHQGMSLHLQ